MQSQSMIRTPLSEPSGALWLLGMKLSSLFKGWELGAQPEKRFNTLHPRTSGNLKHGGRYVEPLIVFTFYRKVKIRLLDIGSINVSSQASMILCHFLVVADGEKAAKAFVHDVNLCGLLYYVDFYCQHTG